MILSTKSILVPSLMILLVLSISSFARSEGETGGEETALPDWTVLVYMAGDNNLEDAAIDDFNEMESVGSTDRVNIIVQIDRASGHDKTNGNWEDTRRYRIEKDSDLDIINSTRLDSGLGELDMSDPDTLRDFLLWGVENYSAQRYLVILWDHGLGWSGGVCNDRGHYMSIVDLRQALIEVRAQWNHTFDLMGFDACLMGGIEVYYQLLGFANYTFGSEKNEPTDGLPYNNFLYDLVNDPGMSSEDLLDEIASDYVRSYRDISKISVQYSGINLTRFGEVSEKLNDLLRELERELPFYLEEVREARNVTEEYERSQRRDYFDLLDFIRQTISRIDNPRYRALARELDKTICSAVLANHSWNVPNKESDTVRNSTGMTVYFPDPAKGSRNVPELNKYRNTNFTGETLWDEFLVVLFNYNDPDYRASHALHATLVSESEILDVNSDGDEDTFILDYNLSPVKGDSIGNLTVEMLVLNGTGAEVTTQRHIPASEDGNMSFSVEDFGFDHYTFHVFVWDENDTLQDYNNYSWDFQRYGVDLSIFVKDETGNEAEPGTLILAPGENITLYLRVNNTGNSRKLFLFTVSGVPYKYTLDYNTQAFLLEPGERRVFPFSITVLERVHSGTDIFQVSVKCTENGSVGDTYYLSIKIRETNGGNDDDNYMFIFIGALSIVLVVIAVSAGVLIRGHGHKSKPGTVIPQDDPLAGHPVSKEEVIKTTQIKIGPETEKSDKKE